MKLPAALLSLRRDSLRTRLMAWNMLTLALILALVGGLVQFTVQRSLLVSIDRELENRQPPFAHLDNNTPPDIREALLPPDAARNPGKPGPPPDQAGGLPSGPDDHPNPPPDPGPPDRHERPYGSERVGPPPNAQRDSVWHRSRLYNALGIPVSPRSADPPTNAAAFRDALTGKNVYAEGIIEEEPARLLYAPLRFQGRVIAVSQSAYPMTEVNRTLAEMRGALLTLIPVALLLAGIGGAWLTDRALRPVRQITFAAERIGADDLSRRLPMAGDDEFARLAGTFNGMLARLESAFAQRETLVHRLQESIAQQQRFTGDASHELRTPLTIIKANASLLLPAQPTPEEWREGMQEINTAADSMTRLVQDLLLLTRSDGGQLGRAKEILQAETVLKQTIQRVRRPDAATISLQITSEPLVLRGNFDELIRLFSNLLENAQRYTPSGGAVQIVAERRGDRIAIQVRDNGIGIAPEHLPHLCERFYRVDSARSRPDGGTGLGLAICKSIAEAHGGTLAIASAPGKGTVVTVSLPAADAPELSA